MAALKRRLSPVDSERLRHRRARHKRQRRAPQPPVGTYDGASVDMIICVAPRSTYYPIDRDYVPNWKLGRIAIKKGSPLYVKAKEFYNA